VSEAAIDIAVPTYNCAKWLDAFFESLLTQDYTSWRVITRDDASRDNTAALVAAWQERLGPRIVIIENPDNINLGSVGNYNAILQECSASFVMLGDPDDIWKPRKITMALNAMLAAVGTYGNETPIIVCTDAEMVDEELKPISPSFWKWARMNAKSVSTVSRMLMESPALGATMIINRPALDRAMPLSGAAACQDWWLALVGCAFGKIVTMSDSTILYRRHHSNDSVEPLTSSYIRAIQKISEARCRIAFLMHQLAPQAAAFVERFRGDLDATDIKVAEAASRLSKMHPIAGRVEIIRNNLWFSSALKNVGFMLFY
jgi:glycosyltransferase involved in cell wall biosynthesis